MIKQWTTPPKHLTKPLLVMPGEPQLWVVELNQFSAQVDNLINCLSVEELSHAERFVTSSLSNDYIIAHGLLRNILAAYLKCKPKEVKLLAGLHGKPHLDSAHHMLQLEFNMSHTRGLALYAVALESVGVDVELLGREMQVEDIAERFFTPAEYQILCALPQEARQKAFYRCWTLKEAFIKAVGRGLAYGLDKFEVDFLSDSPNCLKSIEGSSEQAEAWSLQSLAYSEEYALAFAVAGKCLRPKMFALSSLDF